MPPNMRSVFAQVHGKSLSMGSHRNFSSRNFSSSAINGKESKKIAIAEFVVTRTLGFATGYLIGHYLIGDLPSLCEKRLEEELKEIEESFKKSEDKFSEWAAAYASRSS